MIFKNPLVLALLPLFLLLFFLLRKKYPQKAVLYPSDEIIKPLRASFKVWLSDKLVYLKIVYAALLILALARPEISEESKIRKEGIAIMLAIDCSSTMLAEDLSLSPIGLAKLVGNSDDSKRLTRLEAARNVAMEFVSVRQDDMIGVVAFAAQAYVVCPLTFDRKWLRDSLKRVKVGIIKDATAIGSGILSCLNPFKEVQARSKVIILLTDGINNFGKVPPLVAAKAARALGVKIYTIGIVSKGQTPFPTTDIHGRKTYKNIQIDIDEDVLRKIADLTGGEYYRVSDMRSLEESYKDIDKLEKIELEQTAYEEYKDIFSGFVIWAFAVMALQIVLSNTYLRRIP